jgi:nucleoside-diphosphate-sugar epimerase
MTGDERQVILGAGPLGVTLQARLQAEGIKADLWSITGALAYDMPGTEPDRVDGTDAAALARVCAGASVVYLLLNAHYVDWYRLFPARLMAAIGAASAVGARLVYHDSIYLYGEADGPLTEDSPPAAATAKGRLRAEMATTFMNAVEEGRIEGAIGRTADMYGPGLLNSAYGSTFGQRHLYPLLAGKTVNVIGDPDSPHAYAYVEDVARGLAVLAREPEAVGRAWHLPAAPARSHRQLLDIAGAAVGVEAKVRASRLSSPVIRVLGRFQSDTAEVAEMLYLFERPLVVSHQAFEHAFEAQPTPHEDALAATLEWYQAHPQYRR